MEKFLENLQEADKAIRAVDHMIYTTFPLVQDKRLLIKVFLEIKESVSKCINALLQYEYLYKRIKLHGNSQKNFETFKDKCAPRYSITPEEIQLILELFSLYNEYKKSSMDVMKNGNVVILSDKMRPTTINIEKAKQFLIVAKSLFRKITSGINMG